MMQCRAALLSVRLALSTLRWRSDPEGRVSVSGRAAWQSVWSVRAVWQSVGCKGSMAVSGVSGSSMGLSKVE